MPDYPNRMPRSGHESDYSDLSEPRCCGSYDMTGPDAYASAMQAHESAMPAEVFYNRMALEDEPRTPYF